MYHLISKWTILPGKKAEAIRAINALAAVVKEKEPNTLAYMPHTPNLLKEKNNPVPYDGEIVFFEIYKDEAAFLKHLDGQPFQDFVRSYGHLFLSSSDGTTFVLNEVLHPINGFIREVLTQ